MILPIHVYGQPVLRQPTAPIASDSPELQALIDDMVETMKGASGLGLAAPQVGRSERLFVADLSPYQEEIMEDYDGVVPDFAREPEAFINPEVLAEAPETEIEFEEGCLSIPDIREVVVRPDRLRVRWTDRHFETHEVEARGVFARVFQHELDHLDGVLFLDHLTPLRRRLLKRRLKNIADGRTGAEYPLFPPVED